VIEMVGLGEEKKRRKEDEKEEEGEVICVGGVCYIKR